MFLTISKKFTPIFKRYNIHILLFVCILYQIKYFGIHIHTIKYNSDSISYFSKSILTGHIDLYRTPIYSLLVSSINQFIPNYFFECIILLQHFIALISIILLYKTIKIAFNNDYYSFFISLIYGSSQALLNYSISLNPEIFCLFGSILFIYFLIKYIKQEDSNALALIGFLPFLLVMLKPVFLYLFVIVPLFFLFNKVKFRRYKTFILSCILVIGYCFLNKYQNGEFTISKISLNNSLANVIVSNSYLNGKDKELINIIDTAKTNKGKFGIYPAVFYLNNEWIHLYKKNELEFKKNKHISKRIVDTDETLFISNFPISKI